MKFQETLLGALFLFGILTTSSSGQIPSLSPAEDEQPVRIETSLIQLDVVVSDKDGNPVKDLKAEDFSVFQDGKLQQIVGLTYEDPHSPGNRTTIKRNASKNERKIQPPSVGNSRQGRVITFVLDDGNCLATTEGNAIMGSSIRKFIDDQMLPSDRVAIYRTAGGTSLLQMYTSDKQVLRRLLGKLNLVPSRTCGSSFTSSGDSPVRRNQVFNAIGVLDLVVDRVKNIPQRKMIFLISEGVVANFSKDSNEALLELVDKAARSSVVINTINAKGLTNPDFLASNDDVLPAFISGIDRKRPGLATPQDEERTLSEGLANIAYATGGQYVRNSNRLDVDIAKVLQTQTTYYLISYEPESETFRGKEFHQIEVKLTRPELTVSSRAGFYGRSDNDPEPEFKTPDSPLYQAIGSAFAETGLDLRMTLIQGHTAKEGHYVRTMIHITGQDLALTKDDQGNGRVEFDVVGVVLDEKGRLIDDFNRSYPIVIPRKGVQVVQDLGLDFASDITFKKPGVYSIRLAVRNKNTKLIGSAGDFVLIPNLKDRDLFVTGLTASGVMRGGSPVLPTRRALSVAFEPVTSRSLPSVRKFAKGDTLTYAYSVHNWQPSRATGKPAVTREVRIYKDGREVETIPEAPIDTMTQTEKGRIDATGVLKIAEHNESGEYVLQLIVRDKNTEKASSQWIDFEVLY